MKFEILRISLLSKLLQLLGKYTYTFINNGTDFIVPTDYVLIINRHLLYFHAFFGADGRIVQL